MVSRSTWIALVAFLSAVDRDSFSVDSPPPALILLLRLDRPPLVLIFLLVLDRPPLALILLLQFDRPPLALILLLQFDRPPLVLIFLLRLGPPPPALIVSCPASIVDLSEKIDEQEGFKLFGTTDSREPENAAEILEEREQKLLFYESTELGRASNLRKSLDWDSGFLTRAVSEKIEEQEGFKLFGTTDSREPENAAAILEEREQKLLFYESTELGRASNLHKSLDWDSGFLTSAAVSERIDEQEGFKLLGTTDSREPENAVEILEEREQKLLFYESTQLGRASNLRKSLDWDSGFFTSAGLLDPEELFAINKGFEKAEAHLLPEVQEDLCRWRYADSESTLDSDDFSLDSNQSTEVDLFEGIRASIKKSNIMSDVCKSGVGEAHKRDTHLSERIDEQEGFKLFGTTDSREPENAVEILEEREQKLLFYESTELGRASNLRKSLDWDSGFFTSAGVLDSEELFVINKGFEKAEAHLLPEVQEDLCRWRYAGLESTLDSDYFSLDSNQSTEVDLFEGIRASIEKSNIMSNICKSGVGEAHKRDTHSVPEKIDEQEGFKLFGTIDSREPENAAEILEEREQKLLFYESTQLGRASNLRKSLDWDSGFFTSAGLLDPEELFVINK
ncbi:uncharacterized protein LOC114264793 isoform X2 [Camellia sinensis]|uniref:uncharacterized protein LOC114264793 isoform X2 n=1 Tax=Camellia sinensis TaxID=4442 RepID=UPI001036BC5C|nr:uncharacterized protein LOC114264793 isoform X2 [Camellia sinensis]